MCSARLPALARLPRRRSAATREAVTARRRRGGRPCRQPAPRADGSALMNTNSDITAWFIALGHWNWFIAAAVFFLIEILAPGTFMMWLGLAALLVGSISLGVEWGWQVQIIAFAVFSIAAIPAWRRLSRNVEAPVDRPFLNRRAEGYVGRIFTLDKPIVDGLGTVRIDDTVWRVSGPDCPAGSRVKIARAEGANLTVEAAA